MALFAEQPPGLDYSDFFKLNARSNKETKEQKSCGVRLEKGKMLRGKIGPKGL